MAQMINLRDLLKHEILDLYSAEEQIIEALPKMVEKANNSELKRALQEHLKVTEQQKTRLDEIKVLMGEESEEDKGENKGFFSRLFGGSGGEKCKGTEGLIKEGEKMMAEDMTPEAMDAAIISGAQKIEHYEICGYGTAAAFARELGLSNVAGLLQQTLDEEYTADDMLTALAVGKINIDAENATEKNGRSGSGKSASAKKSGSKTNSSKGGASKSNGAAKSAKSGNSKSASKNGSSKGSSNSSSKGNASKNGSSKSSSINGFSKGSASKSGSSKGSSNGSGKGSASKSGSSKGSASKSGSSKSAASKGSKSAGNKSAGKKPAKSSPQKSGRSSSNGATKSKSSAGGRRR